MNTGSLQPGTTQLQDRRQKPWWTNLSLIEAKFHAGSTL